MNWDDLSLVGMTSQPQTRSLLKFVGTFQGGSCLLFTQLLPFDFLFLFSEGPFHTAMTTSQLICVGTSQGCIV